MVSTGTSPEISYRRNASVGTDPEPAPVVARVRPTAETRSGAAGTRAAAGYKVSATEDPKFILIGDRKFSKDDPAVIYDNGQTGTILKIGPKQIILWNPETKKERHLTHTSFYKLNK
jgi:hypothetical protein